MPFHAQVLQSDGLDIPGTPSYKNATTYRTIVPREMLEECAGPALCQAEALMPDAR